MAKKQNSAKRVSAQKLIRVFVVEHDGISKPGTQGYYERGSEVDEDQLMRDGFDIASLERVGAIVARDKILSNE
jgi:hypothetical protein